ncbi:MAG: hypothetical protein ACOYJB_07665 [Christensenellaceae bacterium]
MRAFPARCAGKRTVGPDEGYGHSGRGAQGGDKGAVAPLGFAAKGRR